MVTGVVISNGSVLSSFLENKVPQKKKNNNNKIIIKK